VLVAHTCNPSYSGDRHQEDGSSNQPRQIVSPDPISKTIHKNKTVGLAQGEGPEFKSQYCKKKKKEFSK
jgi:hypothetical protein